MFLYNYKNIIKSLMIVGIVSTLAAYLVTDYYFDFDLPSEISGIVQHAQQDAELTVVVQKYHTQCGHFFEDERFIVSAADETKLEEEYSPDEGWVMSREDGKIMLYLPVDELCPHDAEKRHLQFIDERVAVFKGPAGLNGSLLFTTEITKDALPSEWQKKINELEVSFNSEKDLLHALDTLDEYN